MTRGRWVSLFSGGKDSSWALYRALQEGLDVGRLVTVHPEPDSYMYHVPATDLAALAAESIGIPLLDVDQAGAGGETSGERGDAEVEPLEAALRELAPELGGVAGLTVGAVESEFQTSRIEALCRRLGADLYAPLWQADPVTLAEQMLDAGFEITIVQVAAYGLDESWVGRRLDRDALEELRELHDDYGVHVLGEGGEFETLVTDAPHMDRPLEITGTTRWEGDRGHLEISDAGLG
ncbi:MAG: diphthine--ammonia ligase [Halanaeroarchaeum sp.]